MKKINHIELIEVVKCAYKKKLSLFLYGHFGIGKSEHLKTISQDIAKEKKKEFIEWNELSEEDKNKLVDNPKGKFVWIDCRLAEYSPDDIKGLPLFTSSNRAIEFKCPLWALLLEQKGSDGILALEEFGLATPLVQSSVYKIVLDRQINQSKINDNWGVIGATNMSDDRAYTHEIASPLRDRALEFELSICTGEAWQNWAIENKIDSRIIGFLAFKSSNLYKVDFEDNSKYTTPRAWARLSKIIEGEEKIGVTGSGALGEGIFSQFVAFTKISNKVKIQDIIKHPEKLKEFNKPEDLGIKYFIITALADCYREDKAKFKDIMNITEVLDECKNPEFVSLLWRLCLSYKPEFEKEFVKGDTIKISNKYLKYLR